MVKNNNKLPNNKIECSNCKHKHTLQDGQSVVDLDDTLTSIGLKCPKCGHRIHSYFETDELKNKRRSVNRFLVAFRALPTAKSWNKYLKKRDELNKLHDKIQEKYAYLLKVENG